MNGLRLAARRCMYKTDTCTSTLRIRLGGRRLHTPRQLEYPISEGLGHFLPPQALQVVAIDYQNGLLERLNEETKDTQFENSTTADVVIQTAPHESETLAFNYASLALNNSFFLDSLKPPPRSSIKNHEESISDSLRKQIRDSHGSLEQLKSSFCAGALGISTCGWVWFVSDSHGNTAILPTIGPSTLLIQSRLYMSHPKRTVLGEAMGGDLQIPASSSPTRGPGTSPTTSPGSNVGVHGRSYLGAGSMRQFHHSAPLANEHQEGRYYSRPLYAPKKNDLVNNMGNALYPLFCVSVYEHCWMSAGYGVWGKETWLKELWSVLDWQKVSDRYDMAWTQRAK